MTEAARRSLLAWGEAVEAWLSQRPQVGWADLSAEGPWAVVVVDMLEGFCRVGPLSSPRIHRLASPVAGFLAGASRRGAHLIRLEDAHTPGAGEFAVYPAHCLEGSEEAQPVEELEALPAFRAAERYAKNALTVFDRLDLEAHLHAMGVRAVVVVGDCTDLCVEACAMPLRLYANAREHPLRVVVPADLVDTFDAPEHPGDWVHAWALHRMHQNGVEVVRAAHLAEQP